MTTVYLRLDLAHGGFLFDSYLENVEQNDFKKIYRAKHVLSRVEGTPRRKVKYFPNSPNLASFASLREASFSDSVSQCLLTFCDCSERFDGGGYTGRCSVLECRIWCGKLAQLTRTTPESISRVLHQLQAENRVEWIARGVLTIKASTLREYLEQFD
jgi:hypothetical protein